MGNRMTSMNDQREPSSNLSYAASEGDTVSGLSTSEYSSGEEDGDRSVVGNRTGTLRGRPALPDRSTHVSQASNVSKTTGGTATVVGNSSVQGVLGRGKRTMSATLRGGGTNQAEREKSRARRSSVAPRDRDEYGNSDGDDDGRFGPLDDEDDEVHHYDRGEELVRRRMKARAREKAARKKAEKDQEIARRQAAQASGAGSRPLSPRPQNISRQSMVSVSPQLDRDGKPTFMPMPGGGNEFSAPMSALSPGVMPMSPSGAKANFHYPSPHSHIRRPSSRAIESNVTGQGRRFSGMSSSLGPNSRGQTLDTPQLGQDVFSEAAIANEIASNKSFRDGNKMPHDETDEERDTVANLATDLGQRREPSLLENLVDDQEGELDEAGQHEDQDDEEELSPSISGEGASDDDVEYTLKDRQDAINIEHPFGLPIWKPALYKKSRTVTRNAEIALHSIPSAAAERHLLPGNLLWTIFAGFWLSIVCFVGAIFINFIPYGGSKYARVAWGLGGYLFWPFGKYVEVEVGPDSVHRSHQNGLMGSEGDTALAEEQRYEDVFDTANSGHNQRENNNSLELSRNDTIRPGEVLEQQRRSGSSSSPEGPQADHIQDPTTEQTPLKGKAKDYGTLSGLEDAKMLLPNGQRIDEERDIYGYVHDEDGNDIGRWNRILGTVVYGLLFWLLIAPLMGIVCLACWGLVFPIPMAKLTWVLLKNLSTRPLALHFRSAPGLNAAHNSSSIDANSALLGKGNNANNSFLRLKPGQFAPRSTHKSSNGHLYRRSKILLCTYRAMGIQYYKYTVGGVNILFINTLPFVFFTIFDFFFVEPYVHKHHIKPGFLTAISSQGAMFVFALGSVIPLSYFIGMAVASISAQSSIGMGAVINATFGSIVEIILYAIALTQHKARLVEGSIIGSILAGVLLMPGISMCSGATRRKEQRFNAKSAGVTSSMLIMAIIGILTPTLFYQIYGTFQLTCNGCPLDSMPGESWTCKRCFYEHVPPATDPFYQENVKGLMYTCTVILVLSYGIGLWFSLRTHASQIWQNPQPVALPAPALPSHMVGGSSVPASNHPFGHIASTHRNSIYKRLLPSSVVQQLMPASHGRHQSQTLRSNKSSATALDRDSSMIPPLQLPEGMSPEDYERALALTANAFQHAMRAEQQQQSHPPPPQHARDTHGSQHTSIARNSAMPQESLLRQQSMHESGAAHGTTVLAHGEEASSGGHDAPSWTRATSLIVLLSCTVLYAIIAEILVDAVDVVLEGSGLDLKLLGVTLFALVPNATEFMNAMSFAINGNIALSMEIGSAYALQVCLIQIPAMVAFSAFYNANRIASVHDSFTLIFPRWDVIAIIFAIFLLTYTYIEARSNYFRGALCILSYIVLISGFVFAPSSGDPENPGDDNEDFHGTTSLLYSTTWAVLNGAFGASPITTPKSSSAAASITSFGGLREDFSTHPAMVGFTWLQAIFTSLWHR